MRPSHAMSVPGSWTSYCIGSVDACIWHDGQDLLNAAITEQDRSRAVKQTDASDAPRPTSLRARRGGGLLVFPLLLVLVPAPPRPRCACRPPARAAASAAAAQGAPGVRVPRAPRLLPDAPPLPHARPSPPPPPQLLPPLPLRPPPPPPSFALVLAGRRRRAASVGRAAAEFSTKKKKKKTVGTATPCHWRRLQPSPGVRQRRRGAVGEVTTSAGVPAGPGHASVAAASSARLSSGARGCDLQRPRGATPCAGRSSA